MGELALRRLLVPNNRKLRNTKINNPHYKQVRLTAREYNFLISSKNETLRKYIFVYS